MFGNGAGLMPVLGQHYMRPQDVFVVATISYFTAGCECMQHFL